MADIVLYDGVCGFCNRFVQFVLARDRDRQFRFASLQSSFAREILARHARRPDDLDTSYVVMNAGQPSEHLLDRAEAAFYVLRRLGGGWQALAWLRVLPRPLLTIGYNLFARNRYRLFGKTEQCVLPRPEDTERFIAV